MDRRRIAAVAFLFLLAGAASLLVYRRFVPATPPAGPYGERTVRFPTDYSIGGVWVRDWGSNERWRQIGKAQGDVVIPAGKELELRYWHFARMTLLREAADKLGFPTMHGPDHSPLATLKPTDLQSLHVNYGGIDLPPPEMRAAADSYLAPVKGLRSLRRLHLEGLFLLTDAELVYLKDLTLLEYLALPGMQITGPGLKHFRGFASLEHLDLRRTRLSDAGLVHLKGLTSLRTLQLRGTKVTDEGVRELQQALPKCRIDR